MRIRLIATGGTFDKHYDPQGGQLVFGDSVIPAALAAARVHDTVIFQSLFALDSLEMNDRHRQQILAACIDSPEERIVIIHGTDTMRETAEVLGRAGLARSIVLTGAMVPYEIVGSDAFFNLGFALAAAQLQPHGVSIAMQATLFAWDDVVKNRVAGAFERRTLS